jgi:hypothetical protein
MTSTPTACECGACTTYPCDGCREPLCGDCLIRDDQVPGDIYCPTCWDGVALGRLQSELLKAESQAEFEADMDEVAGASSMSRVRSLRERIRELGGE